MCRLQSWVIHSVSNGRKQEAGAKVTCKKESSNAARHEFTGRGTCKRTNASWCGHYVSKILEPVIYKILVQFQKRKSLRNKLGGRRRRRRRRSQSLLLAKEAKETTGNAENLNTPTAERTTKLGDCEELAAQTKKSFTSALAEINKRLQNQGKLWACLASGLPISAHTWLATDIQIAITCRLSC